MPIALSEAWLLLRDAHREFAKDAGSVIAGAIAFFTSLALIPIALLALSLLGHVLGSERAYTHVAEATQQALPGVSQQVLEALRSYSEGRRLLVNVVGTLGLVWSSVNLFALLSSILTTIWIGEPRRGFVGQRLAGLLCLLVGGALFVLNMALTWLVGAVSVGGTGLGALAPYVRFFHFLGSALPYLVSGALAALIFFLLYRFLPAGLVSSRAALAGALPAAVLWLLSRYLFSVLVAGSSRYGRLYGPLAGAVVLLLWIYYSAYIMIFCAELGVVAQRRWWPKT